jgi:hypothetical protein
MKHFLTSVLFAGLCVLSTAERAQAATDSYFEVSPQVVLYNGDALRSSTLGAISCAYHINRKIWVGADFFGGALSVDTPNGLSLDDGDRFLGASGTFYFNIPAILNADIPADLYTSLGLGHLWVGEGGEIFGYIGGGMYVHPGISWLALRFDLKGIFFNLPNTRGNGFNADMALAIGPVIIF